MVSELAVGEWRAVAFVAFRGVLHDVIDGDGTPGEEDDTDDQSRDDQWRSL